MTDKITYYLVLMWALITVPIICSIAVLFISELFAEWYAQWLNRNQ